MPGDTNEVSEVFIHDRRTGKTRRVGSGGAQGDSSSNFSALSADGGVVAFDSFASFLVPGKTEGMLGVFVRVLAP